MSRTRFVVGLVLFLAGVGPTPFAQQFFSLDPASPEVPAFSAAAMLRFAGCNSPAPPPLLWTSTASLAVTPPDNIDALTYGFDGPITFSSSAKIPITYSVTRGSVGVSAVVTAEVAGNGAAGDQFSLQVNGLGALVTSLAKVGESVCPPPPTVTFGGGLTAAPPAAGQSNCDAISGFISGYAARPLAYFSFDPPTALVYPPVGPADILTPGPVPASVFVFSTAAALGLLPGDDIDALAVWEGKSGPTIGTYDPGSDLIFVSLAAGSPTLAAIGASPADILKISMTGPPTVFVTAATLGLAATDDVDALSMTDPWEDLGGGTSGALGQPLLEGEGALLGGTPASFSLTNAPPNAPMLIWVAVAPTPLPALGGTVHALPFAAQILIVANASGEFSGATTWSSTIPPLTGIWFQFIVQDFSSIYGLTLSNGLRPTTQ